MQNQPYKPPQSLGSTLKVLHVYRTFFPDPPGGLQEAIRQIALGSHLYGVETKIFTLSPHPEPKQTRVNHIEVIREKSWCAPASCDLGGLSAIKAFASLAKWADVVHFHAPWPYADILNLFAGTKAIRVMTYHSDIVRQRFLGALYAPLMRQTLKTMDAVVATSPNYAQTSPILSQHVSREKLKIIPLGINEQKDVRQDSEAASDYLEQLNLQGQPFVLALGVLRYYKGLHYLIEAASTINCPIVIAGSGPEKERLHNLVQERNLTNVILTGQVSETEKSILLKSCTVFAFPSHLRSEAFGMVLIEAAMHAKPLVTCEIGSGMSYINSDGETGFIVQPASPIALSTAINKLIDTPALARKMGHAARLRYENLFSGEALGKAYTVLYKELLLAKTKTA